MVRTPFKSGTLATIAVVATFSAAPLGAQEHTWTDQRPDGVAPAGITAARVLPMGAVEIRPTLQSFDFQGTRFGSDFLTSSQVLQLFELEPFAMSSDVYTLNLSYGVTERFTVTGRIGFADHRRELFDDEDAFFVLENSGVTDAEIHGLFEVYRMGAWRAHVQGGISIPTGEIDAEDEEATFRSGPLPYDMQTGGGVVGFLPGATVQTQNEYGTVGLQLLGHIFVGENSRDWRPGNTVEANMWAAYRVNDFISLSSGLRATARGAIEGFDDELQAGRDPGENPLSYAGERVDIPLGLNLRIADGILANHRFGVEFLWTVHEDLDGPWIAADDGFTLSWTMTY